MAAKGGGVVDPCPLRKWYIFGNCLKLIKKIFVYSLFHKTLPESSLQMHWISVRFYEIGGTPHFLIPNHFPVYVCVDWKTVRNLETGCTWVKKPYKFFIFPLRHGGGGAKDHTDKYTKNIHFRFERLPSYLFLIWFNK